MRTLDEITEDGKVRAVFRSSEEYEAFHNKQCASCLVDEIKCPLIDAAFLGFQAQEWLPPRGKRGVYRCKERIPVPAG